ncbi:LacI family DNA-binding transcriptional regulator [Rhizobium rhizoryzae]|uniref:LacI family transcriptional regulator n=1 Tax=Rhizobium rhizoryzae TaxID=451876 RepID=A0A7W6LK73_9HYPH|nr:LacI family DNA-binding transcriptional regulator [Rhizobium rhizoryzae]MBB4145746.1 LacI family transcriptional regulator [Rhizobium rhizoryzae]
MTRKRTDQTTNATAPTSADVARLAGVSQATISLVLNGRDSAVRISPETRERVISAAATLGYTPNHAARSLRQRRTKIITFVLPTLENPYFLEIVSAAQAEASRQGYSVTIISSRNELSEFHTALLLHGAAYDGIIVAGHNNCSAPELPALVKRGVGVVVLQEPSPAPGIHSVRVDLERGGYLATRHLIELGHRRIAHFTQALRNSHGGHDRIDGYLRALSEAGLPFEEDLVVVTENSLSGGVEALDKVLALPKPPTALFAYNDRLAIGALHGLRTKGLKVPEDFAVVGFDGIAFGGYTSPTLTTVDSSREELGKLAMQAVIDAIEKKEGRKDHLLPVRLLVRESCGGAHTDQG